MRISEAIKNLQQLVKEGHDRELLVYIQTGPDSWVWSKVTSFNAVWGPKKLGICVQANYSHLNTME